MRLTSTDWQKFGQVLVMIAGHVPVARACRVTDLERWKFYRMMKIDNENPRPAETEAGDQIKHGQVTMPRQGANPEDGGSE